MDILVGLKNKSTSFKLYLAGCNNILNWSKLSQFTGWWHDSEKAGY